MKWTKQAPTTLHNGMINEEFNDDEKKEKDGDYEIIMPDQSPTRLAFRVREVASPQVACEVSIHRADCDSIIVKVVPPAEPVANGSRGPIELVLLIDVSASMDCLAPVPASGEGEDSEQKGFTVLDLTKHAAYTIVESLNERDTLCVVTFSTKCKVLFQPLPMNNKNKSLAKEKILSMQPENYTYLWSGMRLALDQFSGNPFMTAALMVLTDGRPNERLSNGVVAAMRRWCEARGSENMPVSVHTFGFGYNLQDGLLQSIAELGGGDYCFVPDASMLGTVFNHAIANLKATYAHEAILTLSYPNTLDLTELGLYIGKAAPKNVLSDGEEAHLEYSINLRTIQFGQSRDFFFLLRDRPVKLAGASRFSHWSSYIRATLKYRQGREVMWASTESELSINKSTLSSAEIAFHGSRAMMVDFLSNLFPLTEQGEHKALLNDRIPVNKDMQQFISRLPASKHLDDPLNLGLMRDFIGAENKKGEIELALQDKSWQKWGCHYLSSLLMAHRYQKCFSFKDPGTQHYGKGSQLFRNELDALDSLFDSLPAPPPSKVSAPVYLRAFASPSSRAHAPPSYKDSITGGHVIHPSPANMSRYRNVKSTCFAGNTNVLVVDPADSTTKTMPIEKLRTGHTVKTLQGKLKVVRTVLKCHTDQAKGRTMTIITVNAATSLLVTPWHPVSQDGGNTWFFPAEAYPEEKYPEMVRTAFMGPVYAVQLERQAEDVANDHTINVEGLWGATMGHGLTSKDGLEESDVRVHEFYGDWDAVARSLDKLPQCGGLALGNGTTKDEITGCTNGFLPLKNSGC